MPSSALDKFEKNLLVDVDRILDSHGELSHGGRGRHGLGHITRGGVLILCAAWELYLEELVVEAGGIMIERSTAPNQLPRQVQKEIAKVVRNSKHELKALELCGDGWTTVYKNHTHELVTTLNAPKSTKVDLLFNRLLGMQRLSDSWSLGANTIDEFVEARGDIAHRGRDAGYVTIAKLRGYRGQIMTTVIDTDNSVANYLQHSTPSGRSPWRRRNV
jgi:RiboL-PSP-HEPN